MKKAISIICALTLALLCALPAGAVSAAEWDALWQSRELSAAVHVSPGHFENERIFTWYGAEGDCLVRLSKAADFSDAAEYYGESVRTPEGDFTHRVDVGGLESGSTYYYKCVSEGFESSAGKVKISDGDGFSAIYVSDVHMTGESLTEPGLSELSYFFNNTLENAAQKCDPQLLLSSGDQASDALRCEYTAFVAPPLLADMSVALCIGNHDRKNVGYKYFASTPETKYFGNKSYVGDDYWFVKDGVLFMVLDTNCPDANAHRRFMTRAACANPDVNWRVAIFHHDLHGGRIEKRESENRLLRLLFVPLMDEFKVDLALTGHSHYYTMSDIIYNHRAVLETDGLDFVTDAPGTLYLTSGSVTRPRTLDDGDIPPLGDKIGFDFLSEQGVYNVLTFSETELEIESYTAESDEKFHEFTLKKTAPQGGHKNSCSWLYNGFARRLSAIVAFFNNLDRAWTLYRDFGITIL